MLKTRIIPIILWDGTSCVQTVRFGRPARVFGSLMDAVRVYENRAVDELVLIDIEARKKGYGPNIEAVKHFTSRVFCPMTIGGGIRNNDDIRELLNAGADKVIIGATNTPVGIVQNGARKFGAQCIVLALDIVTEWRDSIDNDDIEEAQTNAPTQAQIAEYCGAGEILLTSVECNGTMCGYNLDIIAVVSEAVDIPVIAHGGCGKPEHMLEAIKAGAHAVAASTMFLFTEHTPRDCSRYLAEHGVATRVA